MALSSRTITLTLFLALLTAAAPARAQTPLPESPGAPKVGEKAPDFTLPDTDGKPVTLSEVLKPRTPGEKPWVLLVFYRGYW